MGAMRKVMALRMAEHLSKFEMKYEDEDEDFFCAGCYVFGHSLGAGVALKVQSMNPSAFRGIYVFEPPIWPLPVPKDGE